MLRIGEAASVQFPMVAHAAEIGWTPIPPKDATAKRGGEAGMLFRDDLGSALDTFNPWMSAETVRQVIERLEALPPTIEGNRDMLAWLRGERQWYDDGEKRHRRVRMVDFDTPGANALHLTWEWKLKPPARKGSRADVMFLVNDVPVAIVEHKNPKDRDAIERGVTQLRRYEVETPELVGAPQLFNVTHLVDYWYGVTWNVSRRFMARWKERPEESYRCAVQSFFDPAAFLRTLAEDGRALQFAARGPARLEKEARDIRVRTGAAVTAHPCDVLDEDSGASLLDALDPLPDAAVCVVVLLGDQAESQHDSAAAERAMRTLSATCPGYSPSKLHMLIPGSSSTSYHVGLIFALLTVYFDISRSILRDGADAALGGAIGRRARSWRQMSLDAGCAPRARPEASVNK